MKDLRKYLAEFIGTCVLVLFGCGVAILTNPAEGAAGVVATSLAFGLSIVAMAYVIGNVSGCHINPAVSLAMLLTKKITLKEFCGYVVAQVAGAFAGTGLIALLIKEPGAYGANNYSTLLVGIVAEVVLTFVFIYTILGVTNDEKKSGVAGIVIGLTLTFVHLLGIGITGTSVNPARSLAPAVFAGGDYLCHVWVFLLAPLVGAALAVGVYKYLNEKK